MLGHFCKQYMLFSQCFLYECPILNNRRKIHFSVLFANSVRFLCYQPTYSNLFPPTRTSIYMDKCFLCYKWIHIIYCPPSALVQCLYGYKHDSAWSYNFVVISCRFITRTLQVEHLISMLLFIVISMSIVYVIFSSSVICQSKFEFFFSLRLTYWLLSSLGVLLLVCTISWLYWEFIGVDVFDSGKNGELVWFVR